MCPGQSLAPRWTLLGTSMTLGWGTWMKTPSAPVHPPGDEQQQQQPPPPPPAPPASLKSIGPRLASQPRSYSSSSSSSHRIPYLSSPSSRASRPSPGLLHSSLLSGAPTSSSSTAILHPSSRQGSQLQSQLAFAQPLSPVPTATSGPGGGS